MARGNLNPFKCDLGHPAESNSRSHAMLLHVAVLLLDTMCSVDLKTAVPGAQPIPALNQRDYIT